LGLSWSDVDLESGTLWVRGLPAGLVELLRSHRRKQDAERVRAAQLWRDSGYVFVSPAGEPINPSTDYHRWKRLLVRAGLRDGRLHDARHTAATVLLILGVPERAVMGLMGWSTTAMAARYQHIRHDVAERVGGLIWGSQEGNETGNETGRGRPGSRRAGFRGVLPGHWRRMRDSNPRGL
jgi:integrase